MHGGNIHLSIHLIIQLEVNPYIGAITVNGYITSTESIVITYKQTCGKTLTHSASLAIYLPSKCLVLF